MQTLKLKPSEKDVLYYLRTLSPFGDRPLKMSVRGIARTLSEGKGQEVSPSTVSRALKELDRLGLIEMELLKISVTVNPFSKSKEVENQPLEVLSPRNNECGHATVNVATQHLMRPRNSRGSKSAARKGSRSSQTIQTNTPNTQRERSENFLEILEADPEFKDFCFRKASELPDRPVLVEKWILSNFKELESLYKTKTSPVVKYSAAAEFTRNEKQATKQTATTLRQSSVQAEELPKVAIALALGEVTQDPLFPEGIFNIDNTWFKKTDWEAMQDDDNN